MRRNLFISRGDPRTSWVCRPPDPGYQCCAAPCRSLAKFCPGNARKRRALTFSTLRFGGRGPSASLWHCHVLASPALANFCPSPVLRARVRGSYYHVPVRLGPDEQSSFLPCSRRLISMHPAASRHVDETHVVRVNGLDGSAGAAGPTHCVKTGV